MKRSSSFGSQVNDDIFVIPLLESQESESGDNHAHTKFLVLPSFMAGVFLGTNNFFLGFISELGLAAAFEFSLGAFILTLIVKTIIAIKSKRATGQFFPLKSSNFYVKDKANGVVSIKWINVLGIMIRPLCNMSF